jgi:4-hydroxy-4-methyl-2-oxoglutarate aldolase
MYESTSLIVEALRRNRISTVEVADSLGKIGVLSGLHSLNQRHFQAGRVSYVPTWGESNWPLHEAISTVPPDTILYVDVFECENRAVLGDIICKYLFLYRRIAGLVVNGLVRDSHRLIKENYPIWCLGETPLGCFNREVSASMDLQARIAQRKAHFEDSIMVCDDSGCTQIAKDHINPTTVRRLEWIEIQEDIWYYCIDTLKWSTFETICLKRYLKEPEVLPQLLRSRMCEFQQD